MAIEKCSWARCGSPATWSCRLCSVVQRKAKLCYVTNNRNYSWVVTILLLYIIALSENQVKYFEKYWRRRTILAAHITKMFLLKLRKQNKYSSLKAMDLGGGEVRDQGPARPTLQGLRLRSSSIARAVSPLQSHRCFPQYHCGVDAVHEPFKIFFLSTLKYFSGSRFCTARTSRW